MIYAAIVLIYVCIVVLGVLAYLMMSQFETVLEMALVSYTMAEPLSVFGFAFLMDTD